MVFGHAVKEKCYLEIQFRYVLLQILCYNDVRVATVIKGGKTML